ncbi:MAG: flagellar basal body P-ring protein FlgI [Epsilonproteobacteria bacterium]|nr:flagellar basal body P-ring protein FlgI [Campylobacterota bacterium]
MKRFVFAIFFIITFLSAEKIENLASVVGVRNNQLIGYGLVVGLNGTGDGTTSAFTVRSLSNLLQTVNVKIDPKDIKSKNIAAVIVTAKLPPFARQGDKLDVTVSSIGDAKSIEGGTLLITPLKGVDGKIYALAQGSLSIGGKNGRGRGELNHPTAGIIPSGALVERSVAYDIYDKKYLKLSLHQSSFKTAMQIENSLNKLFDERVAVAIDPKTIKLKKPDGLSVISFVAKILDADISYHPKEKIVIDERTGTIVAGVNIKIDPVVITHKDLTIKIEPSNDMKKSKDETAIGNDMTINSRSDILSMKRDSVTVSNLARALHKLGAKPKDVISIIESIKKAGAIRAEVEII